MDVNRLGPDRQVLRVDSTTVSHQNTPLSFSHFQTNKELSTDVQQPEYFIINTVNHLESNPRWLPQEDWRPYAGGVIPITTEM